MQLKAAVACADGTSPLSKGNERVHGNFFDVIDIMMHGKKLRSIVGETSLPMSFIPQLIDLHRQGRFPFDGLASFNPFDQINVVIGDSESGKVVKPIVRMPT